MKGNSYKLSEVICFIAPAVYFIMLLIMIFSGESNSKIAGLPSAAIDMSEHWTYGGENISDITRLNEFGNLSPDTEYSIFNVLPEHIEKGSALFIRGNHIYMSVYIDDELVCRNELPESRLYTNSIGSPWIIVPVDTSESGKKIELRFNTSYKDDKCGITQIMIAAEHDMFVTLIKEKGFCFIISILYLVIAVLLIGSDLMLNKKFNKKRYFLFLGMITLFIGLYSLAESQLLQLFIKNISIMHFMSCFTLFMMPMPVILYADTIFPFKNKKTSAVFALIYLAALVIVIILNYTDIADYHTTLPIAHIMGIVSIYMIFISMIKNISVSFKNKSESRKQLLIECIGLVSLMTTGVIDVYRYYFINSADPAKFIRIGLLIFIVMFALSNCRKYLAALELNAKTELISKLAYQDGLTGLYNRTAYNEKLDELADCGKAVGICAFDVNDLKKINDNMGHELGDRLIQVSSSILTMAFEHNNGICYRIGGDEFMAIVCGSDPEKHIASALERLKALLIEQNNLGIDPFKVSIACGSSIYSGSGNIKESIKAADMIMYETKKKMKAAQNNIIPNS